MCGIVGYVGARNAAELIVDGLKRLEYRGYDSAGIAVVTENGIALRRAAGKIGNLETLLLEQPATGSVGLGHTRWATHGRPSEVNAHPHADCSGSLVVVHNGILENYLPLKERLTGEGHRFRSETDTEVIAHLIESHLAAGLELASRDARRAPRSPGRLCGGRAGRGDARPARGRQAGGRGRGHRPGRRRDAPCVGHPRPPSPHPRRAHPGGRRAGRDHRKGRTDHHLGRPERRPGRDPDHVGRGHGREGRLSALHAQGDLRAAPRGERHVPRASGSRGRLGGDSGGAAESGGAGTGAAGGLRGLRHLVPCRHRRGAR